MYISTIVFGVILLFCLWRGYQKGFIHSVTRILGWAIAYPAAIFFTRPLADIIFRHSSLDGLLVYFIAGGLVFVLASFAVTRLICLFSQAIPEEAITGKPSRIGGAVIGAFVGGIAGLLMGYAINLVQIPQITKSADSAVVPAVTQKVTHETVKDNPVPTAITPPVVPGADSFIDRSAKKLVGAVAAKAIDLTTEDTVAAQLTKDFAANPQSTLGHIKQLSTDKDVKALLADTHIQGLLEKGDIDVLLDDSGFQQLLDNEHMQALFASSGNDGNISQQAVAETIVKGWARAQALSNDPRVVAIMADPEFQKQISSSNHVALLMGPQLKELTEIIVSNDSPAIKQPASGSHVAEAPANNAFSNKDIDQQPSTSIYQWTDENGQVHFSDKPGNN